MTKRANRLMSRRRLWLAGAVGFVALAVVAACATASGPSSTSSTTTSLPGEASSTTSPPSPTSVPPTSTPETLPVPDLPDESIPQDGGEAETCNAIQSQLQEYRDIAVETPPAGLIPLSQGLEEFEHEIDFLGKGSDWSISMLEQIFQVRRDWITASSAAESGNQQEAEERQASALALLDLALSVECPT